MIYYVRCLINIVSGHHSAQSVLKTPKRCLINCFRPSDTTAIAEKESQLTTAYSMPARFRLTVSSVRRFP